MALAYQDYYTLEDYLSWAGDWELMDGMPYAMAPSPTVSHQMVAFNIAEKIKEQFDSGECACEKCCVLMETDWQVSNDTVVRPDVMIVCQGIGERVTVTPKVIIEVVLESSTKRDEVMKFGLYQQEGVQYYILAYPEIKVAKVYSNRAVGFKKVGDYCSDCAKFEFEECEFMLDFGLVWR